jgi:hypothetical protein
VLGFIGFAFRRLRVVTIHRIIETNNPEQKRPMTGEQSRQLKVDDRVAWEKIVTDLGTIVGVT